MSTNHRPAAPRPRPSRGRSILGGLLLLAVLMLAIGVGRVAARQNSPDSGNADSTAGRAANNLPLPTTRNDFFLPGTQPNPNAAEFTPILDPTTCDTCHSDPIYKTWRGSMMGQAGRDPLFWAAFAVANDDATDAGEFCLRCHAPTGWFAGRSDGLRPPRNAEELLVAET